MKYDCPAFSSNLEHIVGENYAAFDLVEYKACCNNSRKADSGDLLWDAVPAYLQKSVGLSNSQASQH